MSAQPSVHQLYKRREILGKGAYGSVHKGIELATGNVVALKIINLDTEDDDVADIQREVALLTQLRDAVNTTKYFGCYLDGPRVWIVMEYASGGSVRTLMKASEDRTLEERYIVIIVREMLLALRYLHRMGVIHRDIKADNILITATGQAMLCDFGVSALLQTAYSKRNTLVGTPYWMAPEVAQSVPAYDTKADIWSLGITIYEMVTGTPPHADLDRLKVMHLIPRSKPPRLADEKNSKDMRDFVVACLKELPTERLSADELGKTKWIKAVAKVPVSLLKQLILRYDLWHQAGGSRASLADPLPWEEEEEEDLRNPEPSQDENPWEFDVRSSVHSFHSSLDADDSFVSADTSSRPPPSSLRILFEDEATSQRDPFRTPIVAHATPPRSAAPPSTGDHPTASRNPKGNEDALHTARPADFAFPAQTSTPRAKSKLSAPPSENDGAVSQPTERRRFPPLGPGIPRGIGAATMSSGSSTSLSSLAGSGSASDGGGSSLSTGTLRVAPTYREVRTSRGVADIAIPPADPLIPAVDSSVAASPADAISSKSPSVSIPPPAPPSTSATNPRPIFNRRRSQSSAAATTQPSRPTGASGSGAGFRFPPAAANATGPGPGLPSHISPLQTGNTHNRTSPTHVSVHSPSNEARAILTAHQSTHSLDNANAINPRRPRETLASHGVGIIGGLGLPPSLSRVRSANAQPEADPRVNEHIPEAGGSSQFLRRPSLNRQASVAVMETVSTPPRSVARNGLTISAMDERNARMHSIGQPSTGLRDILKAPVVTPDMQLGIPDLLPPSPSVMKSDVRFFTPTPSSLGSRKISSDLRQHYSPSPTPSESWPPADASAASSDPFLHSSPQNASLPSTPSFSSSILGPAVQPLDFGALMTSHDVSHVELARTVDELARWLSVVEVGLSAMLDNVTGGLGGQTHREESDLQDYEGDVETGNEDEEELSHSAGSGVGFVLGDFLTPEDDEGGINGFHGESSLTSSPSPSQDNFSAYA